MFLRFFNTLSFTTRYILALLIIAILSTLAYINLTSLIDQHFNYGKTINLSGKQRMLTQKIALNAIYYKTANLEKSLKLMEDSHKYLISLNMTEELYDIYYNKPIFLDKRVKEYLQHAHNFRDNRNGKSLTYILKNSENLLTDFDKVVSIYQNEAENKIKILSQRELYLLFVILVILLLEGLFIFRPANNMINENKVKLLEQSRYSAMGEMIENIAHQWRQPLSTISTISSGVKMRKKMNMISDEEIIESFDKISKHTKHLSTTIDDFRSFFKQNTVKKSFKVEEVLAQCKSLTDASYRSNNIVLEINVFHKDLELFGSYGALSQVVLNILNNSKDVLKNAEDLNRRVFITLNKEEENCIIEIYDNGKGIPKKIINKVFEPYFTTKHKSQGTGIGLFMSKKIVSEHFNGEFEVRNKRYTRASKEYIGASFTISIPLYLEKAIDIN